MFLVAGKHGKRRSCRWKNQIANERNDCAATPIVWRNHARRRLVDATVTGLCRVIDFYRLFHMGGVQGQNYFSGNYISPFYSPEILGDSPHSWFGPKPSWWPGWLIFSPALLVLWAPAGFRVTCYYYRGAYYKAFWADPPACTVGEPRKSYW